MIPFCENKGTRRFNGVWCFLLIHLMAIPMLIAMPMAIAIPLAGCVRGGGLFAVALTSFHLLLQLPHGHMAAIVDCDAAAILLKLKISAIAAY